jgi:sulfur carrier protein
LPSRIIEVTVNGERREVPAGHSVIALLELLNIASDRVAIELNKTLIRKRDWSHTVVPDSSRIEIVEFVGGG